jgi:MFS family permease
MARVKRMSEGLDITRARRRVITAALLTSTFLGSLDVTVVGTAMPTIVSELGGVALYGWVFATYLVASTVTVPIYSKMADRVGRRPVWLFGVTVFLLGSALCALAPTMELLIAARGLQGLGGGALVPMTMTIAGDLYQVEERARLQGIIALVWGASSVAGPLVGALILEVATWPMIFWINFPVGGLALVVFVLSYRERVEHHDTPIDHAGAARITLALLALLLGMQLLGARPLIAGGLLVSALIFGAWFVRAAKRTSDPVLPLGLFRDAPIRTAALASTLLGGVLYALTAYLPLVVRGAWGLAATAVAVALIPLSLGWSVGSYTGGRVAVRAGFRASLRIGAVVFAVGLALFFFVVESESLLLLGLSSAVIGVGFGMTISTQNVLTQDRVPWRARGAATGLMLFSRTVGGAVFVAGLGLLFNTLLADALPQLDAEARARVSDPDSLALLDEATRAVARVAVKDAVATLIHATALLGAAAVIVLGLSPRSNPGEKADVDL